MNESRLKTIFHNYIARFDEINGPEPGKNEKYKWEIAYKFRRQMDQLLQSPKEEMQQRMKALVKDASNLLQNQWELPGAALCDYCQIERAPETVRGLLAELFADDHGDLNERQKRIDAFVAGCNNLKEQYSPSSFKYEMGQRAAMVLLGLYDPDHNYLYKAAQANEFADCVEFYDDWGPSTHFRMPVYYRMCDQLVAAMKSCDELMARHQGRYQSQGKPLHEDKNLHILAFDIIYCSTEYHLMNNIPYDHISSTERKKYLENREKAEKLAEKLDSALSELDLFYEAVNYYKSLLAEGSTVKHKVFGLGTVVSYTELDSGIRILARFPTHGDKPFQPEKAIVAGLLSVDAPDLSKQNAKYRAVIMKGQKALADAVAGIEARLEPLRDYLV